ncbi:coniferyl aldehyde dehydrogenase [Platysternon megacephalum]|uniref:Coniferyl aldehyde dehydrogenase n=1 Tax=Platysternon megacephalum TaxID=55544 RepID=A0A4D9DIX4_9SAUR|nr:coniferyl aldehyde dehydrogenase [Platysternon megacephalum]
MLSAVSTRSPPRCPRPRSHGRSRTKRILPHRFLSAYGGTAASAPPCRKRPMDPQRGWPGCRRPDQSEIDRGGGGAAGRDVTQCARALAVCLGRHVGKGQ